MSKKNTSVILAAAVLMTACGGNNNTGDADAGSDDDANAGSDASQPGGDEVIVAGEIDTWDVVAVPGAVYWVSGGTGGGLRALIDGAEFPISVGATLDFVELVAADDANVYTCGRLAGAPDLRMLRVPFGGAPVDFNMLCGDVLASDGTDVYWNTTGQLLHAPVSTGGAGTLLVDTGGGRIHALAIDATHAYWVKGGVLEVIAKNATGRMMMHTSTELARAIAIDADAVYIADAEGAPLGRANLLRMPKAGGTPQTVAEINYPTRMLVAGGHVYWTSIQGSTVERVAVGGGTPEVLASGQQSPRGLSFHAGHLYWAEQFAGSIHRMSF